jgi:translation initiation factor 2D
MSTPVDIKHSNYKNLTTFLKTIEKDGLLRLKDFKGDMNILGVNPSHPEVQAHVPYQTVGDKEKREETKIRREKSDRDKVKEIIVREFWKPHAQSVQFFEAIGKKCVPAFYHQLISSFRLVPRIYTH